ncbi:MAG: glycosyltransferase family 8 protein [Oscillospiraceae bacterium]
MERLKPAYRSVNICYATNENYAPYLAVSMYSLLKNAAKDRVYDIVILHSAIPPDSIAYIEKVGALFPNCSVRMVDMMDFRESVKDATHAYITAETNYRLAILGELFAEYDRVLYIDCDTIVEGDVSELFDTDLGGNAVGGAEAVEARVFCMTKKGFFIDGYPYNFEDYAKKFMGITDLTRYFNAGVTLFDLKRCRKLTSAETAVELLNKRRWMNNDQDVLNMLFTGSIYKLDQKWNYTTNIEQEVSLRDPRLKKLLADVRRTEYGIIHYTSGRKPWNSEVPLGEHYHKYDKELKEEHLWQ